MSAPPPMVSGGRPLVGHALEFVRQPEKLLWRGYREHGLAYSMRLGSSNAVVLLGEEHSRFVFAETDQRLSIKDAYPFVLRLFDPGFYFFADAAEYQRQRGVLMPRFRGAQLDSYLGAMYAETRAFEERLGDCGEFELNATFAPLVIRIAARALLGAEFAKLLGGEDFRLFRQFSSGVQYSPLPSWVPTPRSVRSQRANRELRRRLASALRHRRENPLASPDFLQLLGEARYADGDPVPDRVAVSMLLLLLWAGHHTTTGHLGWALIDLLRHPRELARVRAEQQSVGHDEVPTLRQVQAMAHLDNALHETERLRPVVPVQLRVASSDIDYAGHRIPSGAMVFTSPMVSHRLGHNDPDAYRPDRFTEKARSKTALIGFGGGIHRCVGVHFAYLEMAVVLGRLVRSYDLELVNPDPQPVAGASTKWPASPCVVRYRRITP